MSNNKLEYLINMKNSYEPFNYIEKDSMAKITDIDHFPYTRFYRGKYLSDKPIIMDREAGYRKRIDNEYKK